MNISKVETLCRQMNPEQLSSWRVVAASVRGTSHEKTGQFCQDAHYWQKLSEGVLVAAVADGAGSATLGKVGAIVAAQTAVETICLNEVAPTNGGLTLTPDDEKGWQMLLNNALTAAKIAVEAEAVACNLAARDLATTLIVAIATPKMIAVAQIGDGVLVVSNNAGNIIALTAPQRGEYINETTFLVSPNALETAQVMIWQGAIAHIAVITDGLQMLALEMNNGMPYLPFFSPLFRFNADLVDEMEAQQQLATFLRSDRISQRADDDLTLLLATLIN